MYIQSLMFIVAAVLFSFFNLGSNSGENKYKYSVLIMEFLIISVFISRLSCRVVNVINVPIYTPDCFPWKKQY